MSPLAVNMFKRAIPGPQKSKLVVNLLHSEEEIRQVMMLRYKIFAEEMGAKIDSPTPGFDCDHFDDYAHHLVVRDTATGCVVGYTRIITDANAQLAGGFYSQSEFDLSAILELPGRFMEIGRTLIHPDYRTGGAVNLLFTGVFRYMVMHDMDYMIGCASIPMADGGKMARTIIEQLRSKHMSSPSLRVLPRQPLPVTGIVRSEEAKLPPLLKAYIRAGALICGEPHWDQEFGVADVFILFDRDRINPRYARHFLSAA